MAVFPSRIRLNDLALGPPEGWSWDEGGESEIGVSISPSPFLYVEPVGLAMLSAWADYQRQRLGRRVRIDTSMRTPYAYKVGLLSRLAGERQAGPRRANLLVPTVLPVEGAFFDD